MSGRFPRGRPAQYSLGHAPSAVHDTDTAASGGPGLRSAGLGLLSALCLSMGRVSPSGSGYESSGKLLGRGALCYFLCRSFRQVIRRLPK